MTSPSVVVTAHCNQPGAFALDLGDDQSRYFAQYSVNCQVLQHFHTSKLTVLLPREKLIVNDKFHTLNLLAHLL